MERRRANWYYLLMKKKNDPKLKAKMDEFTKRVEEDMAYGDTDGSPGRVLAACQDSETDIYLLVMAVPTSALMDGVGPELFRTPDKKKFLACLNEEMLWEKAQEIIAEQNEEPEEKKNSLMAQFIAEQLPPLFERAREMEPLDI